MKQNEEKLKQWWDIYKDQPKLKIEKTKQLIKKYQQTNNPNILNQVLNGTMYLIYNQIINNYFLNFFEFDIEDIIMDGILIWYEYLKTGKILNIDSYSNYFVKNFDYELMAKTIDSSLRKISTVHLYGIGHRSMASLFFEYIHGLNIDNLELINIFKKLNITAEKLNIDLKLVPYRKIDLIIKPLIYFTLKEKLNPRMVSDDIIEDTLNKVYFESIKDIIYKKTRNSNILQEYYGINDNPKKSGQLAKEYNCCRQNIDQIIDRELKRIRKQI